MHLGSANNVLIAAYGTCVNPDERGICENNPVVRYTQSASRAAAIRGGAAISVVGIRVHGNDYADGFEGIDNLLLQRTLVEHYYQNACYADGTFIVDSVLTQAELVNLYYVGSRLTLVNSAIGPATG